MNNTIIANRVDIAVLSKNKKLTLVIEVKNKRGANTDWAIKMRRNLYVHSMLPNAPYFLLALPEHFYLWKHGSASSPPDYEISAHPLLMPYIDERQTPLSELNEQSLELVVASWLTDVVNVELTEKTVQPHEQWLLDSGLYRKIKNGEVIIEAEV